MKQISTVDFDKVFDTRQKIICIFETLELKINKLKQIYRELLNSHHSKDYVFGIDSLHFQNSLIEIEYNSLKVVLQRIDNRVYCEYYNLYVIIIDYIIGNFDNTHELTRLCDKKKFPVYKHLEKDRVYSINLIKSIYKVIIDLLNKINDILINKETELENDKKKSKIGLNIDNLINAESFNNIMLKGKLKMYRLYIDTFYTHHIKYYTRLLLKCKLHMGIVNQDILLNNNTVENKEDKGDNKDMNLDIFNDIHNLSPKNKIDDTLLITSENIFINSDDENTIKLLVDVNEETDNTKDILNSIISSVSENLTDSSSSIEEVIKEE